ncbi:MAG: acyltransferase family protein [Methylococcales bacterium]|nr:acyltransferase family protein [Methylococcales bacterium]
MSLEHVKRQKTSYIPGIDGLRAIAVLSVILFHLDSSILPGGFSGVDVFFVISGYVVSGSLARETETTFLRFVVNFYARRIVRIYPALTVCIVLVGLLQTLIVSPPGLKILAETAMSAFFGLSNFALIWFNDGYFSPQVEFNTFTHTWSLAVEEQFYLVFPIIFFVWLKGRKRKDAVGVFANWLLAILLTVSLLYSWFETTAAPDHAFYLLPSRFWELACGAMLFKLHKKNILLARSEIITSGCVVIGLVLVGLGFIFSDPKSFPFPWAMLSVVGALFVIAGAVSHSGRVSAISGILDNRVIVYVGKMSYSLYLWHWPILVIFKWTVGLEKPLAIIAAITLTALMSAFSYHVVEKPIRRSNFVLSRSDWYIVSRGLGIIVLCFAFSGVVFMAQPYLSLSVTKDRHNWYPYHPELWPSDSKTTLAVPKTFDGRRMFVLGDSHTEAYSTMLHKLTVEQGVEVQQYTKSGCPIANLLKSPNPECSLFIQQVLSKIERVAKPNDIVFLASLRMTRLGNAFEALNESDVVAKQLSSDSTAERLVALRTADNLIAKLEKASLIVVIDAPKPVFKSPPFRCSDWFNFSNPICTSGFTMKRSFLLEYRKPVMKSLDILMRNHPNLAVWDTFPILCPSDTCSAFENKLPLFFDVDHLSGHGNRVLYPSFLSMLISVWHPNPSG